MTPKIRLLLLAACLVALVIAVGVWFSTRKTAPSPAQTTAPVAPAPAPAPKEASASAARPSEAASDPVTDFRAALIEAQALRDPALHSREFGRILRSWIERDPDAALAFLRQLPVSSRDYTQGVMIALQAIAPKDPERALSLARKLAVTREQLAIYSALFAQFAQQNLQSPAQRIAQVPTGLARENAVRAVTDAWVRTDLSGALAWAQSLSDAPDRAAAVEVVLAEMATKDPLQAIDLAQKSLTGPAQERTVFNALQRLTETDPRGAAGLVKLLPPGEMQTFAAVDVARALAGQNAEEALAWTKTLSGDSARALATKRALEVWAANDLSAASRYATTLPPGREQNEAAAVLAVPLTAADPQKALTWAESLPAAELRPVVLASVVDTWAQRDPAAASRWAAAQPPNKLAALAPQTLDAALSYWVLQDANAAQEFVRTLPSDTQTGAAEFLAPLLSQNNPAGTLAWAQSLSNPQAREGALAAAYARWHDNAPAEAKAWLATANLSPESKSRLQSVR